MNGAANSGTANPEATVQLPTIQLNSVSASPQPAGGFCRVTVAGPRTRVDLAVPATVPLANLLPMMLRYVHQESNEDGGAAHGGWTLTRRDGMRLDPAAPLATAGIREGELLLLRPARELLPPPLYDDVVEIIGDEAVATRWGPSQTRAVCATIGVLAGLGVCAAIEASTGLLAAVVGLALAALLLAGAAGLGRAVGDLPAAAVLAALAGPVGAVSTARILGPGWDPPKMLVVTAALLATATLGAVLVGGADGVFAALAAVGVLGVVAGAVLVLSGTSPARVAAAVAPLALAITTVLPTLSLRVARLPKPQLPSTAAEIADVAGEVEFEQAARRVAAARRLLTGLHAGVYTVVLLGIAVLSFDSTWATVLAGMLAALAALRARLFADRGQVLAPVAAAALAVAALSAGLVHSASGDGQLLGVVAPLLLGVGLLAGTIGLATGRQGENPRLSRLLDLIELLLSLAVVPVALAVWDVYTTLLNLGS